jgi:hypothetical protein
MASKEMERKPNPVTPMFPKAQPEAAYHWVYTTHQGHDIDVQVTPAEQHLYTLTTPWYHVQVRTYDLLETVVLICQSLYGAGTLTIDIT